MTAASKITTILCFLNIQNFLLQFRMFNIEHNYSIVFQIQDLYWSPIWWIKFCFNYFLLLYKWFFSPSFSLVFLPSFIFYIFFISFLFFSIISFYFNDGFFFSELQLGFFTITYNSYYFHFFFSIISFYFNDGFFLRVSAWFFYHHFDFILFHWFSIFL